MNMPHLARSFAQSHPGHRRQQNQDSLHMDDGHGLWVVADGMGGHKGGEIASAIACEVLPEQISAGATIEVALRAAHQKILDQGRMQPGLAGMGTTVVLARERGHFLELAWCGDSRIYCWRNGRLSQCSEDHSVVQQLLKAGSLSPKEAKNHPRQHVISSCLGSTAPDGLEIGLIQEEWQKGDWLLLCSDGLTDELDDEQIATLLRQHPHVDEAGAALLQAALDSGGRDNVSVALIQAPATAREQVETNKSPWALVLAGLMLLMAVLLIVGVMTGT